MVENGFEIKHFRRQLLFQTEHCLNFLVWIEFFISLAKTIMSRKFHRQTTSTFPQASPSRLWLRSGQYVETYQLASQPLAQTVHRSSSWKPAVLGLQCSWKLIWGDRPGMLSSLSSVSFSASVLRFDLCKTTNQILSADSRVIIENSYLNFYFFEEEIMDKPELNYNRTQTSRYVKKLSKCQL